MKQKVVIIGVSYSSRLALARSIGSLACDITLVVWASSNNVKKPIDGYSKYVSQVLFCPKEESAFINLLKEKCVDSVQKVILIPDCDFSVTMVDLHQKELSPYFLMPHINHTQGAIVEWSDKERQKQLAAKFDLNVASSTIIEIKDAKYTIPDNIQYPCFPKPVVSVKGGKAGMFRCNNPNDLDRALSEIVTRKSVDAKVMIEEYMEIEKEYAVLGFSNGTEVSIPSVIQFIVGSKKQPGIALQGKIMPIVGFEDIIEQFKKIIVEIGLVGLFDIDFYQSNGQLYFSELNIRYGGSGYAVVKSGINLPAMFVGFMCKTGIEDMNKCIAKTAIYTNERIACNDLSSGIISLREYLRYVHQADILFIKDSDDSKPNRIFVMMIIQTAIKNFIKKVLKWRTVGV